MHSPNFSEDQEEIIKVEDGISELIKAKDIVCSWCFDILKHELQNKKFDYVPPMLRNLHKQGFKIPFFVKWMKLINKKDLGSYDHDLYDLKGCIGCMSKIDILQLYHYTLQSALNDTRFYPITLKDLPYLIVSITYLYNFKECKDAYDWDIGKHGVKLSFTINRKKYSSTFLPQVALHHKFDHKTTIKKLIRKANYKGEIDEELIKNIHVEKYEGVDCYLTYTDYEKLKSS